MQKTKSTKRALLLSTLSLLVCVSMLIGSTFAWFTDSAASGSNVITAGNLDVVVQYTLDGENWKDLDGADDLFQKGLWEPGHTEVVALRIQNNGTLALKYAANMNIVSETIGKTKDGADIKLSEILTVSTLIQQAADKNGAANPVGDITLGLAFNGENRVAYQNTTTFKAGNVLGSDEELEPGAAHYLIVKVDMAETVGNEANHNGTDIPEINFGINVLATQFTYENDSFGNQYDANAAFGTYVELNAGDDLLAAMAAAKANEPLTIKLKGNVEWPTEGHHNENDITPASSILIDGNGYTITATGSGVTPLGDTMAPMTLKNVKIVDQSVSYAENAWEFTYLELGGPSLTCDNVTFADEIQLGTNATFTNCSFESNEESVYAVWVESGSATFSNCTFTGYRGLKAHEAYGTEISSVVVKDCIFSNLSKKPGMALGTLNADTTVSVTGSTFINCQAGDQGQYIYETDTDVNTIKFTNKDNKVYNNAKFVGTANELLALGGTNVEGVIILTNDIDLNGAELKTIGVTYNKSLEIIGNGHKISNVKVATGKQNGMTNMGMFYVETGAVFTVSNLTVNGMSVADGVDEYTIGAALVGYANQGSVVTLNNVDVNAASVNNTKGNAAIYVGYTVSTVRLNGCDIGSDCTVNGERADKTGAFVGTANGADCVVTVTNCSNGTSVNAYGRVINGATYN